MIPLTVENVMTLRELTGLDMVNCRSAIIAFNKRQSFTQAIIKLDNNPTHEELTTIVKDLIIVMQNELSNAYIYTNYPKKLQNILELLEEELK